MATEDFLKKFQKNLEDKTLVRNYFLIEIHWGRTALVSRMRKVGLEDKILKYHFKPIIMIDGFIDYNKMSLIVQKSMDVGCKSQLQKHGFKEVEAGVYDLWDSGKIHSWAKQLTEKAKE